MLLHAYLLCHAKRARRLAHSHCGLELTSLDQTHKQDVQDSVLSTVRTPKHPNALAVTYTTRKANHASTSNPLLWALGNHANRVAP